METTTTTNDEPTMKDNYQLIIQAFKSSGTNAAKSQNFPADIRNALSKKNKRSDNAHELMYKVSANDASFDV